MKNSLIRFGRAQDRPALLPELPVLGRRTVVELSRNALVPHKLENFEITYVVSGVMEWMINDELVVTRQNDILITSPEDKLDILDHSFMRCDAYFMQVNFKQGKFLKSQERKVFAKKLRAIKGKKVALGRDRVRLFQKIVEEHENQDEFSEGLVSALLFEILTLIARSSDVQGEVGLRPNESNEFKSRCLSYLEDHASEIVKIEDFASHFNYSESHFRSLFRKIFGMAPVDFIRQFRIDLAQRFIREGRYSMAALATHLGFSSAQYFSLTFKKELGVSPSEYRKAVRRTNKAGGGEIYDDYTHNCLLDKHFPDKK